MKLSPTQRELLDWYDWSRRDLPWRDPEVTPWQILVSEFMLQQTPVSRVRADLARLGGALADGVGDGGGQRG